MDTPALFFADRARFIDRIAEDVHDPAQGFHPNRNLDASTGAGDVETALEAFGRTHGDGTDDAVAQLLLDFQGGFRALYLQRVIDVRDLIAREFHVDNGADDLNDTSATHLWFL